MTTNSTPLQKIIKKTGLLAGLFAFLAAWTLMESPAEYPLVPELTAITLLMAIWWITEAIPLAATALLPFALFPFMGIMTSKAVAPVYMNSIIFLFIGGFLIAAAMEKWALNRRVALWIIRLVGSQPSRIIMGFMAATAFLSMWISNTATVVMMVPMALAIILKLEERFGLDSTHTFSISLMLGIAYSASLGGAATLIGTPPNLAFSRIFEITFPDAPPVTFANWMMMALPLALFLLAVTWLLLTKFLYRPKEEIAIEPQLIEKEYASLGPMRYEEKAVLTVSALTACLWFFRQGLSVGSFSVPGWSSLFSFSGYIDDGTVAITMALTMFLIPAREKKTGDTLLEADSFQKLPWHIIILFGGGFALAQGIKETGLSTLLAEQFRGLEGISPLFIIMTVSGSITLLTELTSNTATTQITLPVLASIATAIKINPLFLMIPATISASFAFMMPVATPPNAIVFGSGRVRIGEMVYAGIFMNIIGMVCATLAVYFWGTWVFGIQI